MLIFVIALVKNVLSTLMTFRTLHRRSLLLANELVVRLQTSVLLTLLPMALKNHAKMPSSRRYIASLGPKRRSSVLTPMSKMMHFLSHSSNMVHRLRLPHSNAVPTPHLIFSQLADLLLPLFQEQKMGMHTSAWTKMSPWWRALVHRGRTLQRDHRITTQQDLSRLPHALLPRQRVACPPRLRRGVVERLTFTTLPSSAARHLSPIPRLLSCPFP
jgi:hypothetical protein